MPSPADKAFGPWFVCTAGELLLLGVLATQITHYFHCSGRTDPRWLRWYVLGLAWLACLKTGLNLALIWHKIITGFHLSEYDLSNPRTIASDPVDVQLTAMLAIVILSTVLYIQIYYIYRLYIMSTKNYYLITPIALVLLVGWSLSIYSVSQFNKGGRSILRRILVLYYIYILMILLGDVALTLGTVFFLLRFRQNALPRSATVLTKLIRVIFQSAAPGTLSMMLTFLLTCTLVDMSQAPPASSMLVSKVWAFSLMWTLNARSDLPSINESYGASAPPQSGSRGQSRLATIEFRSASAGS